jgi:hypothetical protein
VLNRDYLQKLLKMPSSKAQIEGSRILVLQGVEQKCLEVEREILNLSKTMFLKSEYQ